MSPYDSLNRDLAQKLHAETCPDDHRRPNASTADIKRWRQYLANERSEAAVYRDLAHRREGEENSILLELAEAESRHQAHWEMLLGDQQGSPATADYGTRFLGWLARRFGSVFVLALAQRAEGRSPYNDDPDASAAMAADEKIHGEVVRGLAMRGRNQLSGNFRAAVFGANDGLVSNLALIIGMAASGVEHHAVLLAGIAGLLAGALSMGAGEFISVRSQLELLAASKPASESSDAVLDLDVDANELSLVYRARGMDPEEANAHAEELLASLKRDQATPASLHAPGIDAATTDDSHETVGTAIGASLASFCFFASGAIIPAIPLFFGLGGFTAIIVAAALVGISLMLTGSIAALLSGGPALKGGLRQLTVGYGAATITYLLGVLFGSTIG